MAGGAGGGGGGGLFAVAEAEAEVVCSFGSLAGVFTAVEVEVEFAFAFSVKFLPNLAAFSIALAVFFLAPDEEDFLLEVAKKQRAELLSILPRQGLCFGLNWII